MTVVDVQKIPQITILQSKLLDLKNYLFPNTEESNLYLQPRTFAQYLFVTFFGNTIRQIHRKPKHRVYKSHYLDILERVRKEKEERQNEPPVEPKKEEKGNPKVSFSRESNNLWKMGSDQKKMVSKMKKREMMKKISLREMDRIPSTDLDKMIRNCRLSSIGQSDRNFLMDSFPSHDNLLKSGDIAEVKEEEMKKQLIPEKATIGFRFPDPKKKKMTNQRISKLFVDKDSKVKKKIFDYKLRNLESGSEENDPSMFVIRTKKSKMKLSSSSEHKSKSPRKSEPLKMEGDINLLNCGTFVKLPPSMLPPRKKSVISPTNKKKNIYEDLKQENATESVFEKTRSPIKLFKVGDSKSESLFPNINISNPPNETEESVEIKKDVTEEKAPVEGLNFDIFQKTQISQELDKRSNTSSKFFQIAGEGGHLRSVSKSKEASVKSIKSVETKKEEEKTNSRILEDEGILEEEADAPLEEESKPQKPEPKEPQIKEITKEEIMEKLSKFNEMFTKLSEKKKMILSNPSKEENLK